MAKKPTKAQLRKGQIHQQLLAIYKARKVAGVREYIASLTKKRERNWAMEWVLDQGIDLNTEIDAEVKESVSNGYYDEAQAKREAKQHGKKVSRRVELIKSLKKVKNKKALRQFILGLSEEDQVFVLDLLERKGIHIDLNVETGPIEFDEDPLVDYMENMIHQAERKLSETPVKEFLITTLFFDLEEVKDNRVGVMIVRVPSDILFFEHRGKLGEVYLHDVSEYHINQCDFKTNLLLFGEETARAIPKLNLPWDLPPQGRGMVLWIRQNHDGQLYVRLPQSKGKGGKFYNNWLIKPVGSDFPSKKYVEDLEAALNAYLRVFDGNHVVHDPRFRLDYGDFSCVDCRWSRWAQVIQDDLDLESSKSKSSSYVYHQVDVNYKSAYGNYMPKLFCGAKKRFMDRALAEQLNEFSAVDRTNMFGTDKDGNYRLVRPDEVVIGGVIVKAPEARHVATSSECKSCPFFHRKGVHFETAKVSKQVLETLTPDGWKMGVPAEFRKPLQFRVRGLSGIVVRGTNEIFAGMMKSYIPAVEFDPYYESKRRIRDVWLAAFNIRKLDEKSLAEIAAKIKEGLKLTTESLSQKWEKAKAGLARAILWAREDQPIPAYPVHFFSTDEGVDGDFVALRVQDVLSEFIDYAGAVKSANLHVVEQGLEYGEEIDLSEYGELGKVDVDLISFEEYEIRTAKELSYRLDYLSDDFVVQALEEGTKYVLVDDWGVLDEAGLEFVAAALQYKLQKKVEDFIWDCRRSTDPNEVLNGLLLTEEAKAFILEHSRKAQG